MALPEDVARYVTRMMLAEDQVVLDALLAGAGRVPACGVRLRRSLGGPVMVAVDPTVPAWQVYDPGTPAAGAPQG